MSSTKLHLSRSKSRTVNIPLPTKIWVVNSATKMGSRKNGFDHRSQLPAEVFGTHRARLPLLERLRHGRLALGLAGKVLLHRHLKPATSHGRNRSPRESQSKPGTKMVNPEPCKELRWRPQACKAFYKGRNPKEIQTRTFFGEWLGGGIALKSVSNPSWPAKLTIRPKEGEDFAGPEKMRTWTTKTTPPQPFPCGSVSSKAGRRHSKTRTRLHQEAIPDCNSPSKATESQSKGAFMGKGAQLNRRELAISA